MAWRDREQRREEGMTPMSSEAEHVPSPHIAHVFMYMLLVSVKDVCSIVVPHTGFFFSQTLIFMNFANHLLAAKTFLVKFGELPCLSVLTCELCLFMYVCGDVVPLKYFQC